MYNNLILATTSFFKDNMLRILKPGFLFCSLFLLTCSSLWGTVYYVDARNGSDDFNGISPFFQEATGDGPWKTIAKVNSTTFAPGDSILFNRGEVWTDGPLDPKNGGAPGGVLLIKETILSQPIQIELSDPNNHNSIYFGAYGTGAKPKIDCKGGQGAIIRHNYIILENFHLDNGDNDMLQFARTGGNYWNIVKDVDVTRCSGNAVRFTDGGGHCWLKGLYVYDYGVNGIYLRGSELNPLRQVLVENCWVEDPVLREKEDGISCHRDREENNIDGEIIIRNNTVIRAGENGIDVTSGSNILLDGNIVEYSYSGGIYVAKSRVNTIEIRGNFLNSNSVLQGVGDLTIASPKVRAVNNIIVGTGHHSLLISNASDVQFWHNIIAPTNRSGNFIRLRDTLSRVEFKNNIFDFSQVDQKINGLLDSVLFDNNCYYGVSSSQKIMDANDFDFEELRLLDPSFEPNGFWADPKFFNSRKEKPSDFKLRAGSPCLDRGAQLPLSIDFWKAKRPNGTFLDIGVFEGEGAPVEEENDYLSPYPNPFFETINLPIGLENQADELHLIDGSGRVLLSRRIIESSGETISLPLSKLAAGAYYIVLSSKNKILSTKRIIKSGNSDVFK